MAKEADPVRHWFDAVNPASADIEQAFGMYGRPRLRRDVQGIEAFRWDISGGATQVLRPGQPAVLDFSAPKFHRRAALAFIEHAKEMGGKDLKFTTNDVETSLVVPEDIQNNPTAINAWAAQILAHAKRVAEGKKQTLAVANNDFYVETGITDGRAGALFLPEPLKAEWLLKQFVNDASIEVNVLFSNLPAPAEDLRDAFLDFLNKALFADKQYNLSSMFNHVTHLLGESRFHKYEDARQKLYDMANRIDDIAREKLKEQGPGLNFE